jgi:hypothetical protein
VGLKFAKSANMTINILFEIFKKGIKKTQNFSPISNPSNPLKKLQKNAPKTDLMNMSKSGKVHISFTFFHFFIFFPCTLNQNQHTLVSVCVV